MEWALLSYVLMVPVAFALILWDWGKRGVEPHLDGALIMALWWPVVFFAVLADVYDEE